MNRIKLPLLVLLSVFLLPFSLYAQSGRKTTEPKATKTEPANTEDNGVNEAKVTPGGETVEGDVIRFDTALVTVPVSVMDRYGRYVPLLRREQFRLLENGVEQKIAYFATTDSPFSVVLLIDTSGSTQFRLEDIHKAAIDFVGSESSFNFAQSVVGKGGAVIVVGLMGGKFSLPVPMFPLRELTITGSYVGSLAEARELMGLVREGRIRPIPVSERPLGDANAVFSELRAGAVSGRVILRP